MKYKILVADDETIICDNIANTVKEILGERCVVLKASNGLEAIHLHESNNFDIIITDIKMAVKNGLDALQEISLKEHNNTAFIIVSGYSEFEYAQRAIELKVVKYLLKPVNRFELEHALNQAISQTRNYSLEAKSQEMMREQAFRKLIKGKADPAEIVCDIQKNFKLTFSKNYFTVMASEINFPSFETSIEEELQLSVKRLLYENFCFDTPDYGIFYDHQSRGILLLNTETPLESGYIARCFYSLAGNLLNYYNIPNVKMGVSESLSSAASIPALYEQSLICLEYKILYPGHNIL